MTLTDSRQIVKQRTRLLIGGKSGDVVTIDHYGEMTDAMRARAEQLAQELADVLLDAHFLLVQIGPTPNIHREIEPKPGGSAAITVNVDVAALATDIKREMLRAGQRNGTAGLA